MLKNMVAMVAGGAGSLGLATVKKLTDNGWKVLCFDLPKAKKTVTKELDDKVKFFPGDITSEEDVEKAFSEIKSEFGKLDVLVNCAGLSCARKTYNPNKESCAHLSDFCDMLKVNIGGTFNTTRLGAKLMAKNEVDENGLRGVIINTSGMYAFDGQLGQVSLAACGGAISSMTLPLCRDLAPVGIRVVTIAPGVFKSNLTSYIPQKVIKHLEVFTPSPKRLGLPEEYAQMVMSIVDNKFLNGETIRLDGGLRLYLM